MAQKENMNEFPDRFDAPEDAYHGFFRADNAKNAHAWAAVMSYPHVRVAAIGGANFYVTPGQYAADADWSPREATGWVRSEGLSPTRLHGSSSKVHLLGGWTRFNAAGERILTNRVTYTLTKICNSWGIQARFGVDSYTGQEDPDAAVQAVDVVQQFATAATEENFARCSQLCRKALVVVGVGTITIIKNENDMANALSESVKLGATLIEARAVQTGSRGAIVAVAKGYPDGLVDQGIMIVGKQTDQWSIAGVSFIK